MDMIDLAGSSSDEGEGCAPEWTSRRRQQNNNIYNVSSSPSLSPSPTVRMTKTNREKKQEALQRARQWANDRKRPAISSPSIAAAARASGRRNNVARRGGGLTATTSSSPTSLSSSSPTPRKMTRREKDEARERARRWADGRNGGNVNNALGEEEEEEESGEGVVVNLLSPTASPQIMNHNRAQQNPIPDAPAIATNASSRHRARFRREMQQTSSHAARSSSSSAAAAASSSAIGRNASQRQQTTTQWACPRCTLLNSQHTSRCGACFHVRSGGGAASAAAGGGGRVYNSGRTSSASGIYLPQYARGAGHAYRSGGAMPTNGYASSISSLFGGGSNVSRSNANTNAFLSQLLLQSMGPGRTLRGSVPPGENVDNMSYERLLELFGDGSDDNRGASSRDIASLPVTTASNPKSELTENQGCCSICLEDFVRGDKRTSLPCMHGFHESCINRWLSSNGVCPVCKTRI